MDDEDLKNDEFLVLAIEVFLQYDVAEANSVSVSG
jgi:hypothetical protein